MDQILYFKGQKMTKGEFITKFGLDKEEVAFQDAVIEKLVTRGEVKFPEERKDKTIDSVLKEMELDKNIAIAEDKLMFKNGMLYPKVELDLLFDSEVLAVKTILEDSDVVYGVVRTDTCHVMTLENITDNELGVIRRKLSGMRAERGIKKGINIATEKTVGAIDFATGRVAVPIARAGVKTTVGASKAVIKAGASIGSSLISSTATGARDMTKELSVDEDVLKARKEFTNLRNGFRKLLNGRNSTSVGGGVRIIE